MAYYYFYELYGQIYKLWLVLNLMSFTWFSIVLIRWWTTHILDPNDRVSAFTPIYAHIDYVSIYGFNKHIKIWYHKKKMHNFLARLPVISIKKCDRLMWKWQAVSHNLLHVRVFAKIVNLFAVELINFSTLFGRQG